MQFIKLSYFAYDFLFCVKNSHEKQYFRNWNAEEGGITLSLTYSNVSLLIRI